MLLLRKMCDKYSSLHILRKFVYYFYAKYVTSIQACTYCVNLCATFYAKCVINIQAYTYYMNLCANFTQICDKYSSLQILCKFVCYFYSKYAYIYCTNLWVNLKRKMCDKYSSLHILREFVCYFYAKCVTYALLAQIRPF